MRESSNGKTSAFEAKNAGSNPASRFPKTPTGVLSARTALRHWTIDDTQQHMSAVALPIASSRPLIGVDLFCGAGGLSAGATAAGVKIAVAVESDPHAAATYRANHPGVQVMQQDLRTLPDLAPVDTLEPTVVFGGPPCQGFSIANQRTRGLNNPSNLLWAHFIRHVRSIRPEFVVFENVRGFVETAQGFFFATITKELKKLGYRVEHAVLNALDYGVPQSRARLFVVAARSASGLLPALAADQPTTVRDAIRDLPVLQNGAAIQRADYRTNPHSEYAAQLRNGSDACTNNLVTRNAEHVVRRYAHIPPGGNWECIPRRLMLNYADRSRCHDDIYHRLAWDKPSIVITNYRKNMLIHPSADRGLSVREAARLQSFPDLYQFTGSIGFQQQQVANAVPPMMAEAVFRQLGKAP